ncbi:hypothetical protein BV25DRAFT_1075982 [Artomyces pyxidatus]|uniref:Uncharacterized protein n=1 Tax=Artomyces pyxidatus TaxID=48021 RepID=A0ACB8TFM5_9AGAM|nr:hypothetical protein BV25DRAFT_1075982 [Artomyces pyxidatus]
MARTIRPMARTMGQRTPSSSRIRLRVSPGECYCCSLFLSHTTDPQYQQTPFSSGPAAYPSANTQRSVSYSVPHGSEGHASLPQSSGTPMPTGQISARPIPLQTQQSQGAPLPITTLQSYSRGNTLYAASAASHSPNASSFPSHSAEQSRLDVNYGHGHSASPQDGPPPVWTASSTQQGFLQTSEINVQGSGIAYGRKQDKPAQSYKSE